MPWLTPPTAVFEQSPPYTWWNDYVRGNWLESVNAKATTAGRHFVATGSGNTVAERASTQAIISTSNTNALTTFGDLGTGGPTVTVTLSTQAWVVLYCNMSNDSGAAALFGYAITGATTYTPSGDDRAIALRSTGSQRVSGVFLHTGLTAGSNIFTGKYRVTGGNGTWDDRRIAVMPM